MIINPKYKDYKVFVSPDISNKLDIKKGSFSYSELNSKQITTLVNLSIIPKNRLNNGTNSKKSVVQAEAKA